MVMSPEEALALIIAENLTVYSYNFIRSNANIFVCDLYPSYKKVNSSFKLLTKKLFILSNLNIEKM